MRKSTTDEMFSSHFSVFFITKVIRHQRKLRDVISMEVSKARGRKFAFKIFKIADEVSANCFA